MRRLNAIHYVVNSFDRANYQQSVFAVYVARCLRSVVSLGHPVGSVGLY